MLKTCKNCKMEKAYGDFSKAQKACKVCRSKVENESYNLKREKDKTRLRSEFMEIWRGEKEAYMKKHNIDEIRNIDEDELEFKRKYVKKEDLEKMKLQTERYGFCKLPKIVEDASFESYADEVTKGYFLGWIMVHDIVEGICRTVTII